MTGDAADLATNLPVWTFTFALVLGRCAGISALLPGLGETGAPAMIRAGFALSLALLLTPLIAPMVARPPEAGLGAALMVGAEIITGLSLGWLARLFAQALPVGAQIIALCLGLSSALQPDPELGPQTAALARLFAYGMPMVLLASGLITLPISAVAGSYGVIAPGSLLPAADSVQTAVATVAQTFALAMRLAAPFLLATIVWHAGMGVLARMVPRLQLFFVATPGQLAAGFALLAALSGTVVAVWQAGVREGWMHLPGVS